jgi:hypothetical protein
MTFAVGGPVYLSGNGTFAADVMAHARATTATTTDRWPDGP